MRSRHAEHFNHDDDAARYDADVTRETHPIRAGYAALLRWVADQASVNARSRVLDLGSGTGNTALALPAWSTLDAVDVSTNMTAIARTKLADRDPVTFIQSDLLEFFDNPRGPYDAVVSSYTIHHLTDEEKTILFTRVAAVLAPGGVAAFGDLMFADAAARNAFIDTCSDPALVADVHDEFFWDVATAVAELDALDLSVSTRRVSELSWGIAARRARSS
jgi:putative AdoMet-dependent methyltransferase